MIPARKTGTHNGHILEERVASFQRCGTDFIVTTQPPKQSILPIDQRRREFVKLSSSSIEHFVGMDLVHAFASCAKSFSAAGARNVFAYEDADVFSLRRKPFVERVFCGSDY